MGKTYKDNPNKWRKNKPQKPWKKQKGNRPHSDDPKVPSDDNSIGGPNDYAYGM